jgi:hypothetical protein
LADGAVVGGGSLTPEQVQELIVFRREYGMSRREVAQLPVWERAVLFEGGRRLLGFDDSGVVTDADGASVIDGGPGLSAEAFRNLVG